MMVQTVDPVVGTSGAVIPAVTIPGLKPRADRESLSETGRVFRGITDPDIDGFLGA
ncbi:MAG TPA: hypothetical protein VHR64_07990 [Thermomicrobiales bacterium]|jgi:hypothetical protein|nr:hypothetical protein [Thermomicrobiales bacterium]